MKLHRARRLIGVSAACTVLLAAACIAGPAINLGPTACGCTHGPTLPAWPVSAAAAQAEADAFASGETDLSTPSWWDLGGGRLYVFADGIVWIAIDGDGAGTVAALYEDEMPVSADGIASADTAQAKAEAFLAAHSIVTTGTTAEAPRETRDPVAYFEVSWRAGNGPMTVAVNASTGNVFWFFDGRSSHVYIPIPAIGRSAARALAQADEPSGATLESGALAFDPSTARLSWGFSATIVRNGGLDKTSDWVEVDASTGTATRKG